MRPDDEMAVHGGEDDYMRPCAPYDPEAGTWSGVCICIWLVCAGIMAAAVWALCSAVGGGE